MTVKLTGVTRTDAEAWFIKVRSNDLNKDELIEFTAWCERSSKNLREYKRVEEDWLTINQLSTVTQFKEYQSKKKVFQQARNKVYLNWVAACTITFGLIIYSWMKPTTTVPDQYITATGEQLTVVLADSSKITLNTNTFLTVVYSKQKRRILLAEGEAFFEVRKDFSRPFIVETSRGSATALGTAYSVKKIKHQVIVSVTEGVVEVSETKDRTTLTPKKININANQQVEFNSQGMSETKPIENSNLVHWKEKFIRFDTQPLSTVIQELNRYLVEPILSVSKNAESILISATIDLTKPNEALAALVISNQLNLDKETNSIY